MLNFVDLFPRTIAVSRLETLTDEKIARAIEALERAAGDAGSGGNESTLSAGILDGPHLQEVRAEVIELCREFSQAWSHEVEDIDICSSWGNVIAEGESLPYHKHTNSYISGAFYLSGGSPLKIYNSGHYDLFGMLPENKPGDDNFRAWKSFNIRPKPGRIVLMPSRVVHCVMTSDSAEKRYSIAFNTLPLGRVGEGSDHLTIRLGSS